MSVDQSDDLTSGKMPNDDLADFQLTDLEHQFCTPSEGGNPYVFNLFELFPEVDSLIESIQDQTLRSMVEHHVSFYREHKGSSGDILTAISRIISMGSDALFPERSQVLHVSPEFQALKNRYDRLSGAHTVAFREITEEMLRANFRFQDEQEGRRQKEIGEALLLPRLGVQGVFQTPGGAIRGVVEPGAEVGGPYTIKTPQGRIRVTKITGASY